MAETSEGRFAFHDWIGDSWCLLISHPERPAPACAEEAVTLAALRGAFLRRGCTMVGLVARSADRLGAWREAGGMPVGYPLIGDPDLGVAKRFGIVPPEASAGCPLSATGPARSVFLIAPDKRIRLILTYPIGIGRNFEEILRALDGLQEGELHPVGLPPYPAVA
ncbi:MAG: redoxin domain-containing protein [Pseudomonadota bacterium]